MKVICIKALPIGRPSSYGWEKAPAVGDVLTVRAVEKCPAFPDLIFYRFEEIVNPPAVYMFGTHEINFASTHFKPIDPPKQTDISFAYDILKKATKKAPANV